MNKEKRRVPKLRFPGFTEDWEQRKLGDLYKRVNERNDGTLGRDKWISVAKMYFQDPDKVQSNNLDTRTYVMKKGDIAFEGHPNNEFKFGRFVLNNIGTGIISELFPIYRPITEYDLDFWKYAIQLERVMAPIFAKSITSSGNSSNKLDHNHFLNQELLVPNIEEQKKIGTLLSILSKNITLHQRKLEHLNLKKKALLQKLFPKNGERYPELRFPGFTDAWEQRKLESLFTKYEDKVKTPNSGYWRLGLRSHCKGTFHTYVDAGNELETAEMNRVQSGNFILNITFAWERALAVTNEEDQDKLVSHRFPQFKPNSDLAIDFFKHTLMDKRFKHHLELSSPGGAGRNKVLKIADMLKYELLVPSIKEQNEISSFLNNVDYIITLHQRKLEHLQLQKKALLQQMFV